MLCILHHPIDAEPHNITPLPTIIMEKEPFLVSGTIKLLHHRGKKSMGIRRVAGLA
jgi:hypothetical protein